MPWCEPCAKYFSPSALGPLGECPQCGRTADQPTLSGKMTPENLELRALAAQSGADESAPWHFKLLVGLLTAYLAWRVVQLFV